jgi:hypothetical protein
MPTTKIFRTEFQIVKPNTVPFAGKSHQYRRTPQVALVAAANPGGVLAVLNADIALAGGEVIEITASKEIAEGTEAAVLT